MAVETALVAATILIPLCAGAIDLGVLLSTQARLDQAMRAAVLYAWSNGAQDPVAVLQAGIDAYGIGHPQIAAVSATAAQLASGQAPVPAAGLIPPLSQASASAEFFCTDVEAGSETLMFAASPDASCPGGQQIGTYAVLAFATTADLPLPLPQGLSSFRLQASGRVRVR